MALLTIFTPDYNHARFLVRLYNSLKEQTCKNFMWIVVDDGSTDNSCDVVKKFIEKEKSFIIKYVYKKNGGLHTAYNEAIKHLSTELAVCVDADDYLPKDSVERIVEFWNANRNENVAGIVGLNCNPNGHLLCDLLPNSKTINLFKLQSGEYHLKNGDRKIIVRSELYKAVAPQLSFPGEKNFNPHYMHLMISKRYNFLVLNEVLCIVDYQENGMSANIYKQFYNSPKSFAERRKLELSFAHMPILYRIKLYIQYWSSCFLAKKWCGLKKYNIFLLVLTMPAGLLMSLFIKIKAKNKG